MVTLLGLVFALVVSVPPLTSADDPFPAAAPLSVGVTPQDLPALLARIESEMPDADPEGQWTMNNTLAAIGIHLPKHRKRAIAIGERLGVYRDHPVSKGCTSPFAPNWIRTMVSWQG